MGYQQPFSSRGREKRFSLSKQVCAGEEAASHIPAPGVMTSQYADPQCNPDSTAACADSRGRKTLGYTWQHQDGQMGTGFFPEVTKEKTFLVSFNKGWDCWASSVTGVWPQSRPVWLKVQRCPLTHSLTPLWSKQTTSLAFQTRPLLQQRQPGCKRHQNSYISALFSTFTLQYQTYLDYVKQLRYEEHQDCVLWHIPLGKGCLSSPVLCGRSWAEDAHTV